MNVEAAFSRHTERFAAQWRAVWALSTGQRGRLIECVLASHDAAAVGDREAQAGIVEGIDAALGVPAGNGAPALSVLAYLVTARERSRESDAATISGLERMGFLPGQDAEVAREYLRSLFAHLRDRGGAGHDGA
ncbi:MAG: hypothetical protein RH859_09105 [Longimicrobiales bacterium]